MAVNKISHLLLNCFSTLNYDFNLPEYMEKFCALQTNSDRVNFVHEGLKRHGLFPKFVKEEKDDVTAKQFRTTADRLFASGNYRDALMNYTCAILWTKTRTSLALAYANRSACLYKLGMHKECITDMNRALAHGYPTEKRPNLIERRDQLLKLKRPERGSFEKTPKIPKSQKSRRNPSARNCIEVQNNEEFGRHIVATRDIRIGDVLCVEEPFACVVEKEVLFHCHECAVLCYNPIPCEDCTRVLFCSEACKKRAASTYHKYECAILASLVEYGMKPALLALKVALLAKQDGYKEVHKLKPATEERSDLFFISTVAAVLFHFLESHTDLFRHGNENHREDFKEIMLLQLQVCPLNAIKIYECVPNPKMHESDAFAAGLYAFASLFNHSCCHNVERTHHGSTIVLRAANTIRKGQQCFISYGFQYDTGSLASRQECLRSAYYFICKCKACTEHWTARSCSTYFCQNSLFEEFDMDPHEFNFSYRRLLAGDVEVARELLPKFIRGLKKCEHFEPLGNALNIKKLITLCYRILGNKRRI